MNTQPQNSNVVLRRFIPADKVEVASWKLSKDESVPSLRIFDCG